jgi:hypothetical protein
MPTPTYDIGGLSLPAFDPSQYAASTNALAQQIANAPTQQYTPPPAAPPQLPPNGVMTDIGHGLAAGAMVDTPKMFGQMMQAFHIAPQTGKQWADAAEARSKDEAYRTTGAWGEGARGVAPSLATLGAGALAAFAAPEAAAATALGVGSSVAAGALFGGSTYTDVKEQALAAGTSPEIAEAQALKAGAIMGAGQAAAAHIGGKILSGAGGPIANSIIRRGGMQNALESFANPSMMGQFGKNFAEQMGVQIPVQAGTAAALNETKKNAGIDTGASNWEAAKASFGPTVAMTSLMSPVSLFGAHQTVQHREAIRDTVTGAAMSPEQLTDPDVMTQRTQALQQMSKEMRKVAPRDLVAKWQLEADKAILLGDPVRLDENFNAETNRAQIKAEQERQTQEQRMQNVEEIDAAPAPQDVEEIDAAPPPDEQGETIEMGSEAGARHERMVANRQTIRDRIAEREQQPSTEGMTVEEIPHTQEIDVHGVPEEKGGANVRNVEDANSRLAAAAKSGEEGPAQMTARLLGLPTDSAVQRDPSFTGREQPVKLNTTEARVKALRGLFGNIKQLTTWAKLEPKDLPTALRDEWNARKGVSDVKTKLAEAYKAMTGREIHEPIKQEVFNESASTRQSASVAAKAASEERARAESERAANAGKPQAAASAEEVAQAQRDAGTGREAAPTQESAGAGEKPLTAQEKLDRDTKAVIAKATAGITPNLTERERANLPSFKQEAERRKASNPGLAPGGVDRRAGEPTSERAAAALAVDSLKGEDHVPTEGSKVEGAGNAGQEPVRQGGAGQEPVREKGRRTQADVQAERQVKGQGYAAPEGIPAKSRALIEQKNTQAQLEQHDREVQKVERKLKGLERNAAKLGVDGKVDPRAQDTLARVREHLDQLQEERKQLVQSNSDTVGAAERVLSGPEPSVESRYWSRNMEGPRAMFGYAAAKDMAGQATAREKTVLYGRGEEAHDSPRARAAAKEALAKLTPEQRAGLEAQLKAHLDGIDGAGKALGGKKVNDALKGESENQKAAQAFIAHMDKALLNNRITYEEYEKQLAQYKATQPLRRGIEGLHDDKLNAVVGKENALHAALAHIAENARNPVMRDLAGRLAKTLESTGIEIVHNDGIVGGQFVPMRGAVEIGRGGMNHITMAHEGVHVASHAAITRAQINERRPSRVLSEKQIAEVKALKDLREVRDGFAKVADMDNEGHRNALENDHEFLAEALTNPDVISKLQSTKGLWQKFVNWLRSTVGLAPKYQTEFEKLVGASNVLFGHPDRSSHDVFRSALDQNAPKDSPRWAVNMFGKALGDISRAAFGREIPKTKLRDTEFAWTSVNHQTERLQRRMQALKEIHNSPEMHARLDEMMAAFRGPRDVIQQRNAESQHLINAPHESNYHMKEMRKVAIADPENFKAMHELSRRARQIGVDPRDTLAEAKARDSKMTDAKYNDPQARKNRAEWNRIKDTPAGQLYTKLRDFSELGLTRHFAMNMDNARRVFGHGADENLHWFTHTQHEGRSDGSITRQTGKLQSAMARNVGEAKAKLASLGADDASRTAHVDKLVQLRNSKADPDLVKKTETDYQKKMDSPEVKEALDHYRTLESLQREYKRQLAQPYVHFGRTGEYMIHFEYKPEHHEAIRKILTGSLKDKTGLDRDMGPDTGNHVVDLRFDDEMQHRYADGLFDELKKAGAFVNEEGKSTYAVGRTVDRYKHTDGATPTFIRKMQERIDGLEGMEPDTKALMKRQLVDAHYAAMPDSNPLKAQMMADMTHGASTDFIQTWAKRQTMQNHALVSGFSMARMGDALNRLDASMKEIRNSGNADLSNELSSYEKETKARIAAMAESTNTPVVDFMRAFTAPFRLALSAGYLAMVGFTPWQMTLPHLGARYGYVESMKGMGRAYVTSHQMLKYLFKNGWADTKGDSLWQRLITAAQPTIDFSQVKNGDGSFMFDANHPVKELLDHLQASGLLNFGQTRQIIRPQTIEGGEIQGMKGDGALGKFATKVSETNTVASIFPHYVEMINRMVAAVAAHEMYLTKGAKNEAERSQMLKNATPQERQDAIKFAMSTIRNTDGDHSQGNVSRMTGRRGFARGLTPLFVGFNQWDFQALELLSRLTTDAAGNDKASRNIARKQLAGVCTMTAAMAGTLGLPLVGLFTGLYNRIASAMQDDGETPPDIQKSWTDAMKGVFGEKVGNAVSHGLPWLADIDMSRSSYADLAPMNEFLNSRAKLGDALEQGAVNFAGPAVGVGIGMAKAARAVYEGNYPTAIEEGLPAFARNAAQAIRMHEYGFEHMNGSNELIPVPVSSWNIMAKGLGFNSATKADISEKQQQWNVNQDVMKSRMEIIRNNLLRASDHDDPKGMQKAMDEMMTFSMMQPQFGHSPSAIADALRTRAIGQDIASQTGGVRGGGKRGAMFLQQFQNQGGLPSFGQ